MKMEAIRDIANAVLYEGYLLYPYRHSAIKNRQRWTLGVVYPQDYSEAHGGGEPWMMRTECLVIGQADTELDVTVRFLHLLTRTIVGVAPRHADAPEHDTAATAPGMGMQRAAAASASVSSVAGWAPDSWEEGMECEAVATALSLGDLLKQPRRIAFEFPAARLSEPDVDTPDVVIVRKQQAIEGAFTAAARPVEPAGAFLLSVRIENTTPLHGAVPDTYTTAMLSSLVSAHTILHVRGGTFVSLLDPPETLRSAAGGCRNERTYPVLVGDEGDAGTMLSSPIILYDYPKIAPESAGALFDGTEIDEILTLRILALTDEEKDEMRQGDVRAREILERTESLTAEQLMKLHGVIRSLGPAMDEGGGA